MPTTFAGRGNVNSHHFERLARRETHTRGVVADIAQELADAALGFVEPDLKDLIGDGGPFSRVLLDDGVFARRGNVVFAKPPRDGEVEHANRELLNAVRLVEKTVVGEAVEDRLNLAAIDRGNRQRPERLLQRAQPDFFTPDRLRAFRRAVLALFAHVEFPERALDDFARFVRDLEIREPEKGHNASGRGGRRAFDLPLAGAWILVLGEIGLGASSHIVRAATS